MKRRKKGYGPSKVMGQARRGRRCRHGRGRSHRCQVGARGKAAKINDFSQSHKKKERNLDYDKANMNLKMKMNPNLNPKPQAWADQSLVYVGRKRGRIGHLFRWGAPR